MSDNEIDTEAMSKSIAEQLMSAFRRREAPSFDDDDPRAGKRVPYERFFSVNEENKRLKALLDEIPAKLEALEGGYRSKVDEMTAAHEQATRELQEQMGRNLTEVQGRMQQKVELVRLGLDDEFGIDALNSAYQRLPDDNRPETVVDYYQGLIEARQAHAADPDAHEAPSIPKTLQGYMPEVKAPEPAKEQSPRSRRGPPPTEQNTRPRRPATINDIDTTDMDPMQWVRELQKHR